MKRLPELMAMPWANHALAGLVLFGLFGVVLVMLGFLGLALFAAWKLAV